MLSFLPNPAGIVSPLRPGVEIHPVNDRVDAAVEDGGQVDDVLHKAWHQLWRLVIHVFPDVIKNYQSLHCGQRMIQH